MDLDTLKSGERISSQLDALWHSRPSTVDFLLDPASLEDVLQPTFARKILLTLQVYVANFYAQYILLHRIAYKAFPASGEVQNAVTRIIEITKNVIDIVTVSANRKQRFAPSNLSH